MQIETITIWKYSHHFVVNCTDASAINLTKNFSRRFIKKKLVYDRGHYKEVSDYIFATANKSRNQFRFHINVLMDYIDAVKQYYRCLHSEAMACVETIPLYDPVKVNLKFRDGWTDKPKQVEPIQWGLDKIDRKENTLLYLWQTGHGKSYMLSRCAKHTGGRIVLFIQPRYVSKWIIDFTKMFDLTADDIPYYFGTGKLLDLTNADWSHDKYPIVMISIDTMISWIEQYEVNDFMPMQDFGYGIDPPILLEHLGASAYMRDEVHETFYRMFCLDLYSHAPFSLNATATLINDNPTVREAHRIMFPPEAVNEQKDLDIYVEVLTAKYNLIDGKKIRTTEPRCRMHSTNAIEKNLMKNPKALDAYIGIIIKLIKEHHLNRAKKGDRCIVYCSLKLFIVHVANILKKEFKDLDVNYYIEKMPYENLTGSDICIATKGKAGTAVDVPGLLTVIDAHIQKTSIGIIQNLGRLRIRNDDQAPLYIRMVCLDWQKQLDYYYYARSLLRDRVKKDTAISLGFVE